MCRSGVHPCTQPLVLPGPPRGPTACLPPLCWLSCQLRSIHCLSRSTQAAETQPAAVPPPHPAVLSSTSPRCIQTGTHLVAKILPAVPRSEVMPPSLGPHAPHQPCPWGCRAGQLLKAKFSAEANWSSASEVAGVAPICTRRGSDRG